jgi:hypothetical protein
LEETEVVVGPEGGNETAEEVTEGAGTGSLRFGGGSEEGEALKDSSVGVSRILGHKALASHVDTERASVIARGGSGEREETGVSESPATGRRPRNSAANHLIERVIGMPLAEAK